MSGAVVAQEAGRDHMEEVILKERAKQVRI